MNHLLTEAGCRRRRERLFESIDADWALVASREALAYFAAFWASPFVFNSQGAPAALLMGRDGSAVLFADNVQEGFAQEAFVTERVLPTWYRCVEPGPHRMEFLWRHVAERAGQLRPSSVAVESLAVPRQLVPEAQALDAVLHLLRSRKEPDEIAQIRECLRIATTGLVAGCENIQPGMTEVQAFALVHQACCEAAGRTVLIYGDFASGPRCEQVGGPATLRRIESGDLVLLDFSVILQGYRGDFANTFACGGQPASVHCEWSDACLAAMHAGEEWLRPGVMACDVHAAVRNVFESRGLGQLFPHHSGHGVGLGHPEPPFLVPQSEEILEVGNVVTLEPGLYASGIGGMRFEHNYAITAGGAEKLSTHRVGIAGGTIK